MALNMVSPGKEKSLLERMRALSVGEQDIGEGVTREAIGNMNEGKKVKI